ncbi:RNA polymerase sigma-70 factor, ECF subfamily [Alkalithermobacter thermoalcaliphilus JW-YL-7 = DSM 7308]|uniref:RNA polymerase sigma-70 factor, ECF subfamily n=1 Tax=Alkalithermobacter thermoalcaliphilus JW-YL-7 = DSM 7308 TaxID=1121328 RepID=A0A150FS87_CLOPD|nr:RNA polymerase, sigma-24 subunit, RpoE, ECF subfamily [[Clostridium] paradoxum JW-YL-7 = DSM 7308]SHL16487.1 RNA polymerase sigma-70 factor, ECF subfamily [[Clostridium] paradoxum JW-YL-7 = DSM 7308]
MKDPELEFRFNEIYNLFWPKVYKFIYFRIKDTQRAEELTQEVFKRLYIQMEKDICEKKYTKSYILTAAKHIVYDLWRKTGDRKEESLEQLSESGFNIEGKEQMINERIVLKQALSKLSQDEQEVINLRIIKGYSVKETSQILKKPSGTIKSLQYRALDKMRKELLKGGLIGEK